VDDLTKEFLAESFEGLDRMDRCLTELESRPDDAELVGEIFRAVHTIKGTTGFLGFSRLEQLAHAGETVLGGLRDGRLSANEELVNGLLQLMDRLRAILRLIETNGTEGHRSADDDSDLIALMRELDRDLAQQPVQVTAAVLSSRRPVVAAASTPATANEKTLRIDVEVLNRMMNLVGELVLTRNQLLQSRVDAANFPELARRLDSVTADLRETVMQARMQPVGHVFAKFPRMVRDLSRSCGKEVRIVFSGQETGLDKSLLEAVKDPLTHAVRNAVDHGIEEPAKRAALGKPIEGTLSLSACHHNGSVVIQLRDDGGGISPSRVIAKALDRGLITPERAAGMHDRDALQLIFLPGFSTAETVTNVSGRGVGMDIVRANIERAGGTVELDSHEGIGTTLRLRVPLTLAIVRALVVRSGGQSFCLPQSALMELVYVPWRDADTAIERMGDVELFRLRERLMPMVRLDHLLGLPEAEAKAHGFYLIVLESEGRSYGLVVDDLQAPEEIVVKPLSPVLRDLGLFSGATVLGSGMLAMILDVAAVGIRAEVRKESEGLEDDMPASLAATSDKTAFLIFEDRLPGQQRLERLALPLTAVERIERVPVSEVEFAGGRALLQYRGELLALEDRGGVIDQSLSLGTEELTLLICERRMPHGVTKKIGMVVGRVVDVASGELLAEDVQVCTDRLAIVNQRLTVVRHAASARELREVA
jgi:two-component system chemotaxis sensor kinase CheA